MVPFDHLQAGRKPAGQETAGVCAILLAMQMPLTIAVSQPSCRPRDVSANAQTHALAIRAARARVVVFPELSLTGYELDADPISLTDDVLEPIVKACATTNSVALVGAPVKERKGMHIATLRVGTDGIEVAYRKSFLGGDEADRFSAGDGAVALDVDGWRLGMGICKDTGVPEHIRDVAALDVDVYVAGLVHRPEELFVQDERGATIARECDAYVAFASFAGPTGGGFTRTAGASTIWSPSGVVLARADTEPGSVARATVRHPNAR